MRKITDKDFYDERLNLDGAYVSRCYFDGCVLETTSMGKGSEITFCTFHECQFVGDGWPAFVAIS